MRTRLSLFLPVLLSLALYAQQPAPPASSEALPPAPGNVYTVTPEPGFQDEPSISVNPANPQQVIAAYQMPAHIVFSNDGGHTWTLAPGTVPPNYKISGDVVTAYDKKGMAVLCYIAFDKLGTENYWARGATRNGIFIRRSLDGGAIWEPDHRAIIEQPTQPGIPFEDKPGMAIDATSSKYAGNIYVGWTEFRLDESVIVFSRSADGGLTFSKPIEISTHHGLPRDDNGAVEGFSAAIATDGTIDSVWADGDTIIFASSKNGGQSFNKSRVAIQTGPLYFAQAGMDRSNGFPQIAIDPHHGKHGRLYVTWSDYRSGDVGVYCATSDDGGKHWTKGIRVNSNPVHDGTDQFFQWLAVDPTSRAVNIIFYDRRSDPEHNSRTTVTLARSTDGAATFKNYAWTTEPFSPYRD
ncbi:MAG TPA: sialidase family protein, partial [Candidatus Koribacter sp.]